MSEGVIALMIPIMALAIPIVAILVSHQQKMAQLIHGNRNHQSEAEIAALRSEVRELKEMVTSQMLALDTYASSSADSRRIQERTQTH